jgi:hypothetical protein
MAKMLVAMQRIKSSLIESIPSVASLKTSPFVENIVSIVIFASALVIRLWFMTYRGVDYYGDSYHHWLISYLTARSFPKTPEGLTEPTNSIFCDKCGKAQA